MPSEQVDVLIIGAGPSGSIAASIVQKQGLKVKVVEREVFPRFVIGESLIPIVMEPLEEQGFLDRLNAQNYQKKYGARFIRGKEVCEFDFGHQYTKGWSWTWQLPRAHFDNVLTEELLDRGVDISFGTTVTNVVFNGTDSTTTVTDRDGKESTIEAKFIIDSSGYGRVLPRLLKLDKPSGLPPRASIFTHVKDVNRPEGKEGPTITFVVVKQDVWMWVIPFSDGNCSIGFVGDPEFINKYTGTTEERLRAMVTDVPYYAPRFKDVPYLFEPKAIYAYSVSVDKIYGPGFALTGNSSEFLDPVFSSGVAFALKGGSLSAELACRQIKGETIDWQAEYQDLIYKGVEVFRSYVETWYDGTLQEIFFSNLTNDQFKRQICSVLAGYVWDETNPFVTKHKRALQTLVKVIRTQSPVFEK